MGRPKKIINWDEFDKLCAIQANLKEIAAWFGCSEDTIERAVLREKGTLFADYYAQKRGKGKISLRRKQFQVALSGNTTMLIWLGKQYLDQIDQSRTEHTGAGGKDLFAGMSDEEVMNRTEQIIATMKK